jgi:hypothetical protein
VPVETGNPNDSFVFAALVDPDSNPNPTPAYGPFTISPATANDGGVTLVDFAISAQDPGYCHEIRVIVAHAFSTISPPTPDSIGGDSVVWFYNPGGSAGGCPEYDAGSLQDGAFPTTDAPSDGLPIVPDTGGGDP